MKSNIDPICGMKGTIKAHGHYFCSENCIRKYEKKFEIKKPYCPTCDIKKKVWYKERLFIVGAITILLVTVSYFVPALNNLYNAFIDYLKLIWWAILLGLLLGGVIDYLVPSSYIEKYLSRHRKRTVFIAVVFGFLMSACSHGILAIAMELYKKGANTSSVIAFLLASPWANLPITILLFGFFGVKAAFLIVSAIIIAIITGLIYQRLEKKSLVECKNCSIKNFDKKMEAKMKNFSVWGDIKKRFRESTFNFSNISKSIKGIVSGSWSLSKMVLWWILIGMVAASFARAFIPQHFFMRFMGPTMLGLAVTLILATIIEVCSEGSAPLAFEIFNQTGAFGNSFTFLMAGVATDYTEIGLIWTNIGKKAALWLPIITVPQIIILGYLFNLLL
ncbi:permease [Candidatus Woesearchaeota archaeon]|nr:permease [Candidatus Woesearchaeota archaeon]